MKYESYHAQQLTKRKNKPWQARLKYKDPISGKWRETTKMLPNVKGKREANKAAEAWFNEMNEAAANSPNIEIDKTIEKVVLEYLDYQLQSGEIEKSTYTAQKVIYNSNVKPYIGDYSFATFDRTAANAWLTKLNNKGLSQGTIGTAYYLVKKVYNYYYGIGELLKNPFTGVKAPKAKKPKVTHLTKEQMDDYLAAVYADYEPKDKFYAAALILFYAGLRRGEVCGLRWRDIDLKNGTISVETAIGLEVGNGKGNIGTYTKQPKNQSSIRTFPLLPQLWDALQARAAAINAQPQWFVCGEKTKYYNPLTFSHDFKMFVQSNNLVDAYDQPLTPHMLRHNLGAIGIRSGMDIASLSRMFGHASRAMTLDTYGDASKDAMILAADKLSNKFDSESEYFKIADMELTGEEVIQKVKTVKRPKKLKRK